MLFYFVLSQVAMAWGNSQFTVGFIVRLDAHQASASIGRFGTVMNSHERRGWLVVTIGTEEEGVVFGKLCL